MKCSNCGSEFEGKFCPFCGKKATNNASEDVNECSEVQNRTEDDNQTAVIPESKKDSAIDKLKKYCLTFWKQSSAFEKTASVALILWIVLCLIAFAIGKVSAGLIALLSAALSVFAFLTEKNIIKVKQKRLHTVALILVIALLIPYFALIASSGGNRSNVEKINWSNLILGEFIPVPASDVGEIITNTEDSLLVYISKISTEQFYDYIKSCKEKEFTVDEEQLTSSYTAFNKSGYKLSLYYTKSDKELSIDLEAPVQYGELNWSTEGLGKLLPIPKSAVGEIQLDDENGFKAVVAETTFEEFESYYKQCSDKGFTVDEIKSDKSYSAKNKDGYKLFVEYIGYNVMSIVIDEPEYSVKIKIDCNENLIFSKYAVEVFVDEISEGTVSHGSSETYDLILKKGEHIIGFASKDDSSVTGEIKINITKDDTINLKLYCYSSNISVENLSESEATESLNKTDNSEKQEDKKAETTSTTESTKPKNLTIDNCPELAAMLSNKAEIDSSYADFADKYAGQIIEFDGRIDYCTKHENYNTRFDYLVSAGNYDPNHQIGPVFKFEDVNYYDLHTDLDTVSVGLNVHIIAEVVSYDSNSGLFYLDPVSVQGR